MSRPVEMPFEYSVEIVRDGHVRLTAEREVLNFVREMIPDGQMAGMMGHRQVPSTQSFEFDLWPEQARALHEELGWALDELKGRRS